ncbi:MAG TPA: shikimate dehydrogenase [Clostridiales bacterium]|nr:shikimate dehydrogenase [Clostridiales bacterium]
MKYGLIGEKLGHSYSKLIHEKLADYIYDLIPLDNEEFEAFMVKKDFTAINVTIPYKQKVIPYLDELHETAKAVGAVNTIVNNQGVLTGYNTDFYGFEYMLIHNNIGIEGQKCLVLGNGGAARAVVAVLEHLKAGEILIVSRTASESSISYEDCYQNHSDSDIIINTTPLGMYPNIDDSPLDLTTFNKCQAVVDLIYNPLDTKLTLQARELGIKSVTGLLMLVAQAKQAIEYFLRSKIEDNAIDKITNELVSKIK